ncbi:MAG: hypothetical protein ABSE63_13050 [Thermoguttaceae bacterium]
MARRFAAFIPGLSWHAASRLSLCSALGCHGTPLRGFHYAPPWAVMARRFVDDESPIPTTEPNKNVRLA